MLLVPEPANHVCPAGPTILFLGVESNIAEVREVAVNPPHLPTSERQYPTVASLLDIGNGLDGPFCIVTLCHKYVGLEGLNFAGNIRSAVRKHTLVCHSVIFLVHAALRTVCMREIQACFFGG